MQAIPRRRSIVAVTEAIGRSKRGRNKDCPHRSILRISHPGWHHKLGSNWAMHNEPLRTHQAITMTGQTSDVSSSELPSDMVLDRRGDCYCGLLKGRAPRDQSFAALTSAHQAFVWLPSFFGNQAGYSDHVNGLSCHCSRCAAGRLEIPAGCGADNWKDEERVRADVFRDVSSSWLSRNDYVDWEMVRLAYTNKRDRRTSSNILSRSEPVDWIMKVRWSRLPYLVLWLTGAMALQHQMTKDYYNDYFDATEPFYIAPRELRILSSLGPRHTYQKS